MSWWIDNQGRIHYADATTAQANAWQGPYPSRAAAQAALGTSPPPRPRPRGRGSKFTGRLLARLALRYQGASYVYGGNASAVGVWDCSSFVSFVFHLAGLALPGGRWGQPGFPPNSHGPVVVDYANWAGATTVGTPEAGDLCCWVGEGPAGHIGIAISSTEMISALNPQLGTRVTPIDPSVGPAGSPLIFRRPNGLAGTIVQVAAGQSSLSHPPVMVVAVVAGLYVAAAGLVVALAAGVVAGGRRAMGGRS
jgi:cell wall-associated NlpC family hydrolase